MKKNKFANILKAISAVIGFIAGLITGGTTPVLDNITNFLN